MGRLGDPVAVFVRSHAQVHVRVPSPPNVRAQGPPAGPTKPRSTLQRQPVAAATAVDVVLLLLGHDVHAAAPVLALNEPTGQAASAHTHPRPTTFSMHVSPAIMCGQGRAPYRSRARRKGP